MSNKKTVRIIYSSLNEGLKTRKSMSTKSNEMVYWKGDIVILL